MTPTMTSDKPTAAETDWRNRAACFGHDPELWFSTKEAEQAQAIAICNRCPVKDSCRVFAREAHPRIHDGIWAGRDRSVPLSKPPKRAECGTRAGYQAHQRAGENPCVPCTDAASQYTADKRAEQRAKREQARTQREAPATHQRRGAAE